MNGTYAVRVNVIRKRLGIETIEKEFKTAAARERWIEKMEKDGKLYDVVAFSDPE